MEANKVLNDISKNLYSKNFKDLQDGELLDLADKFNIDV